MFGITIPHVHKHTTFARNSASYSQYSLDRVKQSVRTISEGITISNLCIRSYDFDLIFGQSQPSDQTGAALHSIINELEEQLGHPKQSQCVKQSPFSGYFNPVGIRDREDAIATIGSCYGNMGIRVGFFSLCRVAELGGLD
jgi:hypothetical protein